MNWVSFSDLQGRFNKLKTWLVNMFKTKADTVKFNDVSYKVENGVADIGTCIGDLQIREGDGMSNVNSAWKGWIRLARFRLHRGNGGGNEARGSGFSTIGTIFGPTAFQCASLMLQAQGWNKGESYNQPWVTEGNAQNYGAKLFGGTNESFSSNDIIIALDKTNTQIGDHPNCSYGDYTAPTPWDATKNPFNADHGNPSYEYGYIFCEIWVRHNNGKQSCKYYFSNATFLGYTSKVTTISSYPDSATLRTHYQYTTDNYLCGAYTTLETGSFGYSNAMPSSGMFIDNSVTGTSKQLLDTTNSGYHGTMYYNLYNYNTAMTHTSGDMRTSGIPIMVCCTGSSVSIDTSISGLSAFADTVTDSTGSHKAWSAHTPTYNQPYFADCVFNGTEYLLLKCDEPAQNS